MVESSNVNVVSFKSRYPIIQNGDKKNQFINLTTWFWKDILKFYPLYFLHLASFHTHTHIQLLCSFCICCTILSGWHGGRLPLFFSTSTISIACMYFHTYVVCAYFKLIYSNQIFFPFLWYFNIRLSLVTHTQFPNPEVLHFLVLLITRFNLTCESLITFSLRTSI